MFSTILDICKFVFDFQDKIKKVDDDKIQRVSELLLEISNILKDTYDKLSSDIYPHNNCVVLSNFCYELENILKPYLDEEKIKILVDSISESVNIEKLFHQRQNKSILEQLLISSGEFQSFSMIIKIY